MLQRLFALSLSAAALAVTLVSPALADDNNSNCQKVNGKFSEYVITPFGSPNDPLGRVVLVSQGTVNSIGTAILTSVGPGPTPGTLGATTKHVFLVSEEDQLTATGVAVFTPIPNSRNVNDVLTLTVTGGTGKYASATGTIVATGVGINFFPLPPGPSSANVSSFHFSLSGQLCGVKSTGHDRD